MDLIKRHTVSERFPAFDVLSKNPARTLLLRYVQCGPLQRIKRCAHVSFGEEVQYIAYFVPGHTGTQLSYVPVDRNLPLSRPFCTFS